MYKILLLLLACAHLSWLHATENVLIVGTNAEFPPFTYIENQKIVGFDIDIANEVAIRLGKAIQFKDMPFDALIPEITLGNVDFVAAGLSYTDARAERVFFTKPYLAEDPLVIFSKSKENMTLDDLKGKNVVVIEGFTADTFMSSKPGITLTRLPAQADGFMAIKSGRANAFITAKSTVDAFYQVQDASSFHMSSLSGTGETCALVVPKNKPELLADIQKALNGMESDGTMANLKAKWKLR